jgi:hypothetical protein
VLVAAADPHNPVRGWPAAKEWGEPRAFFARFKQEKLQLRRAVDVTTEGGSGIREPGPQQKPPRKTHFNDMESALAAAVPDTSSKARNAIGQGVGVVGDNATVPGRDKLVGAAAKRALRPHLI